MKISAFICSVSVLLFAASCTSQNFTKSNEEKTLVNTCWKITERPCGGCFTLQKDKVSKQIQNSDPYTYLCFSENKVLINNNCTTNYANYSFDQESGILKIENSTDGAVSTDCNRPEFPTNNYRVDFEKQRMKIRLADSTQQ